MFNCLQELACSFKREVETYKEAGQHNPHQESILESMSTQLQEQTQRCLLLVIEHKLAPSMTTTIMEALKFISMAREIRSSTLDYNFITRVVHRAISELQ